MNWSYERLKADGKIETVSVYTIDSKKEYTGKFVFNVRAYFDENPDLWKANGWTKHITWEQKEIDEKWPHNKQTQLLMKSTRNVDEHTIEDTFYVVDKSEEMMRLQELMSVVHGWDDGIVFYGADV